MPWFERTGMISHRHPFYGVGYLAEDMGPPEDLKYDVQPDAEQMGPPSSLNLPSKPSPTPSGTSWLVPLLIGGVALFLFMGTTRLKGK